MKEIEDKIDDLARAVASGFNEVRSDVRELGEQVSRIENRMESVENRLTNVERRIGGVEEQLEETNDILSAVAKAVDKDAEMLIEHGERISTLEEAR